MFLNLFLKNALQYICLVLPLLPLLYVKLSGILMFDKNKKQGVKDFKFDNDKKNINKSPSIKTDSKETITAQIKSCEHELKIHQQNGNNRMIAYKLEEIKDLKSKLK